jgi:hypothetical protein
LEQTQAQNSWTALNRAVLKGRADSVRLLLDAGADKNASGNVRASARPLRLWLGFCLSLHCFGVVMAFVCKRNRHLKFSLRKSVEIISYFVPRFGVLRRTM